MFSPLTIAQVGFEKKEEIGAEGKNSQAFLAFDPQLSAEIVIKQVNKPRPLDDSHQDEQLKQTYYREARALYASAHPNVVQIHYACEDENSVYVAMPFYKNGSLKRLLSQRFLTVREIVVYGCQVLSGLHNIHSKGLIHFDIKPDNVLLSDQGDALITDFGLAEYFDEAGLATPGMIYPRITPPEALMNAEVDRRHDIYQFGITLLCMCNGEQGMLAQLQGFNTAEEFYEAVLRGTFPDRKSFQPHIPAKLRKIVARCLEVDVTERYQSALDVANDLAALGPDFLDWQLEIAGNDRVWLRDYDGNSIRVVVDADGSSKVTKTVGAGKPKEQKAGAAEHLSEAGIQKLLARFS